MIKSFRSYPVNMIINYNIYGDRSLYHPEPAYSLMGAAYAPLRPEFRNVEYPVREQAEAVLLTTGGSDRYDLAGQILRAVPKEIPVVFPCGQRKSLIRIMMRCAVWRLRMIESGCTVM